jgi:hypothetical protein
MNTWSEINVGKWGFVVGVPFSTCVFGGGFALP